MSARVVAVAALLQQVTQDLRAILADCRKPSEIAFLQLLGPHAEEIRRLVEMARAEMGDDVVRALQAEGAG